MSYRSNRCTGFTTRPLLVTYWPFGLGAVSGGYTKGMGRGHRRHYRSGSLGRGYEVWSAPTYQTLFWPQQFWPLRQGPEIAVLSHPAATLTEVAGRPAQGQLSPPEGHTSPEHHAMEVSSWCNHWTKFPRICPGETLSLQSGELGHCQMPLG